MFLAANFIFDEILPILSNDLFIEEIYLAACNGETKVLIISPSLDNIATGLFNLFTIPSHGLTLLRLRKSLTTSTQQLYFTAISLVFKPS